MYFGTCALRIQQEADLDFRVDLLADRMQVRAETQRCCPAFSSTPEFSGIQLGRLARCVLDDELIRRRRRPDCRRIVVAGRDHRGDRVVHDAPRAAVDRPGLNRLDVAILGEAEWRRQRRGTDRDRSPAPCTPGIARPDRACRWPTRRRRRTARWRRHVGRVAARRAGVDPRRRSSRSPRRSATGRS